jgi:hypothetical protein
MTAIGAHDRMQRSVQGTGSWMLGAVEMQTPSNGQEGGPDDDQVRIAFSRTDIYGFRQGVAEPALICPLDLGSH